VKALDFVAEELPLFGAKPRIRLSSALLERTHHRHPVVEDIKE
jgi:hypothetical protein